MFKAKVVTVILSDLAMAGRGVDGDPIRRVYQFYTTDGELLMQWDPCQSYSVDGVPSRLRELLGDS